MIHLDTKKILLTMCLLICVCTFVYPDQNRKHSDSASIYYMEGINSFGDVDKMEFLNKSIENDSSFIPSYLKKAEYYLESGFIESSIREYSNALKYDSTNVTVLFQRTLLNCKSGNYVEALSDINTLLKQDSLNSYLYHLRGMIHFYQSDFNDALDDFAKGISLNRRESSFYFDKGYTLYLLSDYENAIDAFSRAIHFNRKDIASFFLRGTCYHVVGKYKKALSDFTKCKKLDNKYIYAYTNAALSYIAMDDIAGAEGQLGQALLIDSSFSTVYYYKSLLCYHSSDTDCFFKNINQAIYFNMYNPDYFTTRAGYYMNNGDTVSAAIDYSKALSIDSTDINALTGLAKCQMLQGDLECSYRYVQKGLTIDSLDPVLRYLKIVINLTNGQNTTSYADIEALCKSLDDENMKMFLTGFYFYVNKNFSNALKIFLKAPMYSSNKYIKNLVVICYNRLRDYRSVIKEIPDLKGYISDEEMYYRLAEAYRLAYSFDTAFTCYEKALALQPECLDCKNGISIVLRLQGKNTEALWCIDSILKVDSTFKYAYYNRGIIFISQKKFDWAIEEFEKAIALDSTYMYAYYQKGIALNKYEKPRLALAQFNKVIELDSTYPWAYIAKGQAMAAVHNYQSAIKNYNIALKIDSTVADAYFSRGLSYSCLGRDEMALKDFYKTLSINDSAYFVYPSIASILSADDKISEAVECYNLYLKLGGHKTSFADIIRKKIRELGFEPKY